MIISTLTYKDIDPLSDWLASLNEQDEHFIAWLESDVEEIKEQLEALLTFEESLAWVGTEDGNIVGFIGIVPFFEQGLCRMIGPFSTYKEKEKLEALWMHAKPVLERYFSAVKVAFFKQNEKLTQFCEGHGFTCYNIEKTLVLPREQFNRGDLEEGIKSYHPSFYEGVKQIHPTAGFYTMDEMVHLIQHPSHHLWVYEEDSQVKGYLYFEAIEEMDEGEICFVNVIEGERGQGIGSKLIQYACDQAFHHLNLSLVTLPVRAANEQAEKLYKELGFQEGPTIYAYEKLIEDVQ